jgi:hypothetical protein
MTSSSSVFNSILNLPGSILPIGDISILFSELDTFPFSADILHNAPLAKESVYLTSPLGLCISLWLYSPLDLGDFSVS